MKRILLTNSNFVAVDDEDFEVLSKYTWHITHQGYAMAFSNGKSFLMHRLVNRTPKGLYTDHIDRNRLNNQRGNLRSVTCSQNLFNVGIRKNNTSGVSGVTWSKGKKRWKAYLSLKRRQIHVGYYLSLKLASLAVKEAKKIYHVI